MTMEKVYLITKNQGKLPAAKGAFDSFGIELNMLKASYLEIQTDTSTGIAGYTALLAAKKKLVKVEEISV